MRVHRLPTTRPVVLPEPEAVDQLDAEALVDLLTRLGALAERARARLVMTSAATPTGTLMVKIHRQPRLSTKKKRDRLHP